MIVFHPRGAIHTPFGRQFVACEPARELYSVTASDGYAATPDPRAVTCPSCKGTEHWRAAARRFAEMEHELAKVAAATRGGVVFDDRGCCG
jgi:hypothetical protein